MSKVRHRSPRTRRPRRIPGLPLLPVASVGVLALAGGSVLVAPTPSPVTARSAYEAVAPDAAPSVQRGLVLSAAPVAEGVLLDRGLPVSRDSERQALSQRSSMEVEPASGAVAKQGNAALQQFADKVQEVADKTPQNSWKLPLQSYQLTATFGEGSALWANRHTGLDFAAPTGTVLTSITTGQVISASYAGAYGNRIVIRTPEGTELYYCHLSAYAVQPGDQVSAGQTIGKVGATGNVTGPHLHLEVRPGGGDPVDPFAAMVARGVRP